MHPIPLATGAGLPLYKTPDQALRRYAQLKEQLTSIPAYNLAVLAGKSIAQRCAKCEHTQSYFAKSKKLSGGGALRKCRKCGAAWPEYDADIPKGSVQLNRPISLADERHFEYAHLAVVFQKPPIDIGLSAQGWRVALGLWAAYSLGGASHQALGEEFAQELSEIGRGNSRETIRRIIGQARRIVAYRLGL